MRFYIDGHEVEPQEELYRLIDENYTRLISQMDNIDDNVPHKKMA